MNRDQAAYLIARTAWPNEREENLRSWYQRLMREPDIFADTCELARARLDRQAEDLRDAIKVCSADVPWDGVLRPGEKVTLTMNEIPPDQDQP